MRVDESCRDFFFSFLFMSFQPPFCVVVRELVEGRVCFQFVGSHWLSLSHFFSLGMFLFVWCGSLCYYTHIM